MKPTKKTHDPVVNPDEKSYEPVVKPVERTQDPAVKPDEKSYDPVCHLPDPVSQLVLVIPLWLAFRSYEGIMIFLGSRK